jgi:hypothetical protein
MTFDEAFLNALRAQALILSDDEQKRARFVARHVAVAMLGEARSYCGFWNPETIEDKIDDLIQQIQEEGK